MTAVHITTDDIRGGVPRNCEKCAGALAIFRAFAPHGFVFVSVDQYETTAGRDHDIQDSWITVTTPDVLAEFIAAVDDGLPVVPIEFELDLGVVDLRTLA